MLASPRSAGHRSQRVEPLGEGDPVRHADRRVSLPLIVSIAVLAAGLAVSPLTGQEWRGDGRLNGEIIDDKGQPLADAELDLFWGEVETGRSATTGKNGRWTFGGLADGVWRVAVTASGFYPTEGVARLGAGLPAEPMSFRLRPLTEELYDIDPQWIYVGGYSGGGRVTSGLAFHYGDVFRGALSLHGVDYFRSLAVPDRPGFTWNAGLDRPERSELRRLRRELRYVIVTGERDFNRQQSRATYDAMVEDGFEHVVFIEMPNADHATWLTGEWLERALDGLDRAPRQAAPGGRLAAPAELRLEKVGAAEHAFHVVATLIVGPTESILWDAQYKVSDGRRLAERIAATRTKLKAVVLSHADHDHYMGAMAVIERFPETPVYMTEAGLADFIARSRKDLALEKEQGPDPEVPDRLVEPEVLPAGPLFVDGNEVVVIDGLTGDVRAPASAALWIPSLRTVLAGDLVFEGIHPWLGDADLASRSAWRESLRRLAALEPKAVVPGHKRDLATPDSPAQIDFMIQYLDDYDASMKAADQPEDVVEAMVAKYPDLTLVGLMAYGAKTWFKK